MLYSPPRIARIVDLTRLHWRGRCHSEGDFHSYDGCVPIVVTNGGAAARARPAGLAS